MHPLALIPYPRINPVMLRIFGFPIRWYGMAYLTGFILAYFLLIQLARRRVLRMPVEWISDLVGWLALGVVAGGRAGWWIFYHRPMPGDPPEKWFEPFAIWHGGMSFHGGLLGVIVVLIIWSRASKVSFLNLADCMALVTPIGLCLGRIANFINGELVGRVSHVPWAMIFPGYVEPRHPSQLYESFLEGPVLLGIVWLIKAWRNRRDGSIAAGFVIFYGIIRFGVEFTREPDPQLGYIAFGWLTMGQILSAAICLVGIVWWIALLKNRTAAEAARNEPINPPAFAVK